MNEYRKPEVAVLGDAASLIQGSKPGRGDSRSAGQYCTRRMHGRLNIKASL